MGFVTPTTNKPQISREDTHPKVRRRVTTTKKLSVVAEVGKEKPPHMGWNALTIQIWQFS